MRRDTTFAFTVDVQSTARERDIQRAAMRRPQRTAQRYQHAELAADQAVSAALQAAMIIKGIQTAEDAVIAVSRAAAHRLTTSAEFRSSCQWSLPAPFVRRCLRTVSQHDRYSGRWMPCDHGIARAAEPLDLRSSAWL